MSIYRATFRSMAGLATVLLLSGASLFLLGSAARSPALVCLGLAPLVLLVALRLRLRVVLTPESLAYTGLLRTQRVAISEITAAVRSVDAGYLASRWFGPFAYELRSPGETVRINLRLFPAELGERLSSVMEARGLASRSG
jgi:hypothetical protein